MKLKSSNLRIAIFEILKENSPKQYDAWGIAEMFDHKNTKAVHMILLKLSQTYENIYFERKGAGLLFHYEKRGGKVNV